MRGNIILKLIDRFFGISLVWLLGKFLKKKHEFPQKLNSILVVKLSALGDTILLIPVLRSIKRKYPDAKITVLCTKINLGVLELCPYVNNLLVVDIKKLLFNPFLVKKLFGNMSFDIGLDFDQWTRISPLFLYFAKAGYKAGFKTENQYRHFLYDVSADHSQD